MASASYTAVHWRYRLTTTDGDLAEPIFAARVNFSMRRSKTNLGEAARGAKSAVRLTSVALSPENCNASDRKSMFQRVF